MSASVDPAGRPYRQLARNARLANVRLDRACAALYAGEWEAPRTSFFPSIKETMIHLLNADRFYIDALRGERPGPPDAGNRASAAEFAHERAQVDDWLIAFCESLTAQDLSCRIQIHWPTKVINETVADTLLHIFLHGQHHRGQIHSMLSGTNVPPPQIDEFILSGNDDARVDDLKTLGWTEDRLAQ
ncbi:nuclease [Paramesorhizobium deserti]|uniref:Nuclease n=1 Tax=Paramesorhizobium deserti TaxID=1494590 RepID=A0A135HPP7_9HYPH|nr:DinB family protein [Paramesorhizobium deserti]KXF75116.1 nuclease [Paramesorhizobium deserti]